MVLRRVDMPKVLTVLVWVFIEPNGHQIIGTIIKYVQTRLVLPNTVQQGWFFQTSSNSPLFSSWRLLHTQLEHVRYL